LDGKNMLIDSDFHRLPCGCAAQSVTAAVSVYRWVLVVSHGVMYVNEALLITVCPCTNVGEGNVT